LEHLGQMLTNPECRCINLVGPGGIGKTRLAVQAAEVHFNEFAHGAAFIHLAPVGSLEGVVPAIANAINVAFFGPDEPKAQLLSYLNDKQMLLILDNVEHLVGASSNQENITQLLVEILQAAPQIKLLVTSREALNFQEEWLFEVQGLAFPELAQTTGLDHFDAVALFVQRSRRAFPRFVLDADNQAQIARICRLVEGMPLAIELAATWMRTLSPAEIAAEISENSDFLSADVRDLPERHRSIRMVFDHSWQRLSPDEQQVLSKLSVFRGGFQRQAAEQVAGATLSILSTLVNRTLLRRTAAGRYDLHELIHQYCMDKLASDPTVKSATLKRHGDFYLTLAETANQELQGRNQLGWLIRLDQEHDNLRVALEWTLVNHKDDGDGELALRLSAALRWFWRMRGHFHEGCEWLCKALQHYQVGRTEARARALTGISLLMNGLGELGAARQPAEESVAIFRELGIENGLAEALMIEGLTFLWQGESDKGREQTQEALETYRKVGDRWGEAQALYRLGSYLADYGSVSASEGKMMLEESARILESFDEKYLYTSVLVSLAIVDMKLGNYDVARLRFEGGLTA
ncbi:MAG TPA: AAA family ATPase, partial [Anaerolineales bacterium]